MSRFSVIVPTLNEERHVGSLLSDVAAQTRRPDEVLVADAGSTDGTVSVARRFPFVRLLEGEPPVACGRNLGARSATGDVLIFLDADVRPHERFFEGFLRQFERRRLDVACPVYVPHRSTRVVQGFPARSSLGRGALHRGQGGTIQGKPRLRPDPRMILRYSLMALIFALGKFGWANRIDYEFGRHKH
jgi:glycosyltransferase involved in cell wall biosynthesis